MALAETVNAPACDAGFCGFESRRPPETTEQKRFAYGRRARALDRYWPFPCGSQELERRGHAQPVCGCGEVWSSRRPVTSEIASSNLVFRAERWSSGMDSAFSRRGHEFDPRTLYGPFVYREDTALSQRMGGVRISYGSREGRIAAIASDCKSDPLGFLGSSPSPPTRRTGQLETNAPSKIATCGTTPWPITKAAPLPPPEEIGGHVLIAQSVERSPEKRQAPGSIPGVDTATWRNGRRARFRS